MYLVVSFIPILIEFWEIVLLTLYQYERLIQLKSFGDRELGVKHADYKKYAWPYSLLCDNYVLQWWVELDNELNWLFTNR